jgi:hypothetical protein
MAIKIVKSVRHIGQATFEGVSFPESLLMVEAKAAFDAVQAEVRRINAVTTRPAIIKILVEQEVVTDDD